MKLLATSMMAALALYSSPFTDCGDSWSRKEAQDAANQPPPTKYCATDPPNGCGTGCLTEQAQKDLGVPPGGLWLTPLCSDLSAGDLTALFKDDARTILVCDTEAMGGSYVVFPTFFSIAPKVVETGDGCVPPPPPPPTLMLKDLIGE